MFGVLGLFIYLTLQSNPRRPVHTPSPAVLGPDPGAGGAPRSWQKVYAELYGPEGLERTWEVATPKGYFDEGDREHFLKEIPAGGRFGAARMTVKEDGPDLVFGIYYKGAIP